MSRKLTTEEFVQRSNAVHGSAYDYSNVKYTNTHTKVLIVCKEHGEFFQRPNRHLQGDGCPVCGGIKASNAKQKDTTSFIQKAHEIHGDTYDYSNTQYTGIQNIVSINCRQHGPFDQRASDHIHSGAGCPTCGNIGKSVNKMRCPQEFLAECDRLYGDQYDYSDVVYRGNTNRIVVGCKTHGPFEVTPTNHIHNLSGCPACSSSRGERYIHGWLKRHKIEFIPQHTFDDCVSPKGHKLKYDFFIPASNLLIEFDGEQHYHPVDLFGGDGAYKERVLHDDLKNEYADKNEINILRIMYNELDICGKILEDVILL